MLRDYAIRRVRWNGWALLPMLAACFLLLLTPAWGISFEGQVTVDGVVYQTLPETSTAVVVGDSRGDMPEDGVLTVRAQVSYQGQDYAVVAIGQQAFLGLPNLKQVHLPESIVAMGDLAFSHCQNLGQVTLPDSLQTIGNQVFYNTPLQTLQIPAGVREIGTEFCAGVNTITGFTVDEKNTSFKIEDNVLLSKDGTRLIAAPVKMEAPLYQVPEGVESIDPYVFMAQDGLTEIGLPKSFKTYNAYCLEAPNVAAYTVAEDNPYFSAEGGVLLGKNDDSLLLAPSAITGAYKVPEGVKRIAANAFQGCQITSLELPQGLEEIGTRAFAQTAIGQVTIPGTVSVIGENAFMSCRDLRNVQIENGVTTIGKGAFKYCAMAEIELPASIRTVGEDAFLHCENLASFHWQEGVKEVGPFFLKDTMVAKITVPASLINVDPNLFYGMNQLERIEVAADNPSVCSEDGVMFNKDKTTLLQYPLHKQGHYKVPSGVIEIGPAAFQYSGIEEVTLPATVTLINDEAFAHTPLKAVGFSQGLTSIGRNTFYGCDSLEEVALPGSVTEIKQEAFAFCGSLKRLALPKGMKTIGPRAFNFSHVDELMIPAGLENGKGGFSDCTNVKRLYLLCDASALEEGEFAGYDGLKTVLVRSSQLEAMRNRFDEGVKLTGTDYFMLYDHGSPFVTVGPVTKDHKAVEPADPVKSGYTFQGWYGDALLTTPWDFATDKVKQDTTLYAKWEKNSSPGPSGGGGGGGADKVEKYAIVVEHGTGGSVSPQTVSVEKNKDITFTITPAAGYEIADVLIDAKSVGAVTSYTFQKVNAGHTLEAVFRKLDTAVANEKATGFTDVSPTDWFAPNVAYVVEKGLMKGTAPNRFEPNAGMDRGMAVTVLYRLAGSPSTSSSNAFQDVAAEAYYASAVAWATEKGVTKGIGEGQFAPGSQVSREQLAVLLWQYAKNAGIKPQATGDLTGFSDGNTVASWAGGAMGYCVEAGIINGSGGKLDPKGNATRAEVAAMLQRFAKALEAGKAE